MHTNTQLESLRVRGEGWEDGGRALIPYLSRNLGLPLCGVLGWGAGRKVLFRSKLNTLKNYTKAGERNFPTLVNVLRGNRRGGVFLARVFPRGYTRAHREFTVQISNTHKHARTHTPTQPHTHLLLHLAVSGECPSRSVTEDIPHSYQRLPGLFSHSPVTRFLTQFRFLVCLSVWMKSRYDEFDFIKLPVFVWDGNLFRGSRKDCVSIWCLFACLLIMLIFCGTGFPTGNGFPVHTLILAPPPIPPVSSLPFLLPLVTPLPVSLLCHGCPCIWT